MGMHWVNKCQMKTHYPSREQAHLAARSLARRRSDDAKFSAYHCRFCGGWVVGRREWGS